MNTENKLDNYLQNKIFLFLGIIIIISIFTRVFFLPFDTPFKTDAIDYFTFAIEISKTNQFPTGILKTSDGWSLLLSPIFSIIGTTDIMTLVNAQRITSIIISSLTIIPVYFLCKKFVSPKYAIIGAGLFGFNHRLMENSILGLTESLFLFFMTLVLFFSLSKNSKFYIISFIFLGLASITRYEALLFVIPLSIIFFIRFRKTKNSYLKFPLFIFIFILILLPVASLRLDSNDMDGFTSHYVKFSMTEKYPAIVETETNDSSQIERSFISISLINALKFLGLASLPFFIFFIPTGIFNLIKKRNTDIFYLLFFGIFLILPAIYAYGRDFQEVRYLFILFPIFCVISTYGLSIIKKSDKTGFIILILAVLIFSSLILLNYEQPDHQYYSEIYQITRDIVKDANGVNGYPGSSYLKLATLEAFWPNPLLLDQYGKASSNVKIISSSSYVSIEDYIINSKKSNLTHIVLTENNRSQILDNLMLNYDEYPYLEKIIDSDDYNFKNKIIVLKINYSIFDNLA
tara:strand:+ start:7687 stop:9237 length:1551 start_codon:yes stop_codon:yes gene_type:complete